MTKKERELPEALEIPFVICDNTVNRKGWRLLVEGIDSTGFLNNPVCCVQHNTWSVPVGKWKHLKVENSTLSGVVEFDRHDDEAVKLYWKYKDGYMNAVSLHVIPLTESEEPALLLPGQKYATITTSELLEISLVTVPGQKNAIKLCTPDGENYSLNLITEKQTNPKPKMDGKEKENAEARELELKGLREQLAAQHKLNAKNLIKLHVQRGVVQDGEVEHLTKLAETDCETVEKMLDARTPAEAKAEKTNGKEQKGADEAKRLAEQLKAFAQGQGGAKTPTEREAWTMLDWFKKDPDGLALMAKDEPEKYKAMDDAFKASAKKEGLIC